MKNKSKIKQNPVLRARSARSARARSAPVDTSPAPPSLAANALGKSSPKKFARSQVSLLELTKIRLLVEVQIVCVNL